ncbi:hypothetical protein TSAR_010444 [Trichomalopsis sarcophagae]|uniref:Uncharacterized protein n=1 Tax=Trichomalopsis sarcophagae TaxID=543379 RepID=A0A232EP53_9HYME|nr:hypothetical protein TSAR_010444 [Trichomalopsis sarcophagae]
MEIGLQVLRVQFIKFVNFHDPKTEGLLSSDQLTVTSGFKGNAGMSHCTLRACRPIFMAKQCIDL